MIRRFFQLSLLTLLLTASRLHAATPEPPMPDSAGITGIGAIVIFSQNPDGLAAWYADSFGLRTPIQQNGGHFGAIPSADGPIHFGIMTFPPEMPVRPGGSVSLTFRVDNFAVYLAALKSHGLTPMAVTTDEEGSFAFFVDPDGNGISIWGR